jgi:hypothetical protein
MFRRVLASKLVSADVAIDLCFCVKTSRGKSWSTLIDRRNGHEASANLAMPEGMAGRTIARTAVRPSWQILALGSKMSRSRIAAEESPNVMY